MTELLKINKLSVELQGKTILSDVNLSITAGDILGLVGPSGCGKTTLLNTVAGFIYQNQGELIVDGGEPISTEHTVAPEHRNIGMIFQDYALFPHLTIEKNILFGIDKLPKVEQRERLNRLVDLLKLTDLEQRYPHQLSGGQQQRVAIARALAPQPKLLLLDEPFSNIDARLRNELMLEMRLLLKQLNISAIFVTHNKDEVFTFADKIAVMHQGHILQAGSPTSVCKQPNSWQVADFLQLGSWIPLRHAGSGKFDSAFGCLEVTTDPGESELSQLLLLKPQFIEFVRDANANVVVENVAVTEQGFHYGLKSLTNKAELAFEQLSFYSDELFSLGQQIAVTVRPHQYVVFSK